MTTMNDPPDKRFLIAVLIFGTLGGVAGARWLSGGRIVIREGETRIGVGGQPPRPEPQDNARVAGVIGRDRLLFYPLCGAWIALGACMVALPVIAVFRSDETFCKLSAYTCPAFLLLAFLTVAVAIWSGP